MCRRLSEIEGPHLSLECLLQQQEEMTRHAQGPAKSQARRSVL